MTITSSQIVADACSIAKAPGYTAQGGRAMNLVLNDLCQHRFLKMLRKQTTISITANSNGPFALPTDYYRTYDFFYTVNNFPYKLTPMSQEQYDLLFKDPSIANYPQWFTTDLTAQQTQSAGSVFVYPQTTTTIAATLRYMVNMPDIATPETSTTVPWFPDQEYLTKAIAAYLMLFTDDERKERLTKECEDMLRLHLILDGDEEQVVKNIRLDPLRFRFRRALRPTKTNPY